MRVWNTSQKWSALGLLVIMVICCAGLAMAEEEVTPPEYDPGGDAVPTVVLSEGEQQNDTFEQTVDDWAERVTSTATWMDSFFDNERYSSTSNKTYVRARLSPTVDRNGLGFNSYVDVRLQLPNTERWLVNFGGDPDDEDRFGSTPLDAQERADSSQDERNVYLGISSFLKRKRTRNVGFGGGVRFKNRGLVPYASFKWVELWEFDNWDLRGTQRFRYYTDTGLETKTQVDVEWPIARKFFARTTGSFVAKVNDVNQYVDVDYSLYQYLTDRQAFLYQVITGYLNSPSRSTYLSSAIYQVQYRQQWRDWLSTSLIPQLAQYDSRDWKLEPGIRLDFNIRIGHTDEYSFTSPYEQKQKNLKLRDQERSDAALHEAHERYLEAQEERTAGQDGEEN